MVRNSLKLMPWKDDKAVTADLKLIDQASTELEAQNQLAQFALTWDEKYPQISKSWGGELAEPDCHQALFQALFDYPAEIRRVIDTTNAIESLNSLVRTVLFRNRRAIGKCFRMTNRR